jgi:hypothetical protein
MRFGQNDLHLIAFKRNRKLFSEIIKGKKEKIRHLAFLTYCSKLFGAKFTLLISKTAIVLINLAVKIFDVTA